MKFEIWDNSKHLRLSSLSLHVASSLIFFSCSENKIICVNQTLIADERFHSKSSKSIFFVLLNISKRFRYLPSTNTENWPKEYQRFLWISFCTLKMNKAKEKRKWMTSCVQMKTNWFAMRFKSFNWIQCRNEQEIKCSSVNCNFPDATLINRISLCSTGTNTTM